MHLDLWQYTYLEGNGYQYGDGEVTSELLISSDDRSTFEHLKAYLERHPVHSTLLQEIESNHESSATFRMRENLNFTGELQFSLVNGGWQTVKENKSEYKAGGGPGYMFGAYRRPNPKLSAKKLSENESLSVDWLPALEKLVSMFKSGMLTEQEFEQAKKKLLSI